MPMLKQRVITALVLVGVLLPVLFYEDKLPFQIFSLILVCAASWEWARLNGLQLFSAIGVSCFFFFSCLLIFHFGFSLNHFAHLWIYTSIFWLVVGLWLLRSGVDYWSGYSKFLRLGIGLIVLLVAWLAVASSRVVGINFLVSCMALVWTADITAYFIGRRWGCQFIKTKLAPNISPGKTWEGAVGGLLGILILAAIWINVDSWLQMDSNSLFTVVYQKSTSSLVGACFVLAGFGVMGDLLESLVKRSASVKDSSNLLPGHGGVLDRLDALLPTMPLAMMLYEACSFRV